jgi:competence protein ComEC
VRTWALERLARLYPHDQHTTGLLQATLLGETNGVERRWTEDFRITGTYHALVISGQHVSVLALSILLVMRSFRFRKVPALCVATLASWLYAFVSGFSSPVVRAAGGFTLGSGGDPFSFLGSEPTVRSKLSTIVPLGRSYCRIGHAHDGALH